MKKLVFLSIMAACTISFAQSAEQIRQAEAMMRAQIAKQVPTTQTSASDLREQMQTLVVPFKHLPSQKQITIFQNPNSAAAQILKEGLQNAKKLPMQEASKSIQESISGGWQPEVAEMVKAIVGAINEGSRNLGDGCNAKRVVEFASLTPVDLAADLQIELGLLSPEAQECLRK